MRSVGTRPPLRAWQGPPPCLPRLGRTPFGPSLPPSLKSDLVSFLPSSQPHEAFRSFLSGSGAGSPVLTCAPTVGGGRAALPQWQPAASAPEALRRQGRQGGPGAGRGRSSRGRGPPPRPGRGPAPLLHLPPSGPPHPHAARPYLGKVRRVFTA